MKPRARSATTESRQTDTVDILEAFGPLAAMHAALERQGIGLPCSAVGFFPARRAEALHLAVARVAARLPVLTSGMAWQGDRALLRLAAGGPAPLSAPMDFRADETGVWGYRLTEDGDGVWLVGAWAHAAADGPSMLRFLAAVACELNGERRQWDGDKPRPPSRRQAMAAWLPGFVLEHARRYKGLNPENRLARPGACFAILPPDAAERLDRDSRRSGVAGRLAAATAACLLEQQRGRADGEVYLNVPIARGGAAALAGFGFEGSSLRLPLRLSRGQGFEAAAVDAGERLRRRIEQGWDLNLLKFLSGPASRRMKFASIQASKPPDPCLTISWKGRREGIGAAQGLIRVACFAAAPTLHLSAHVSDEGLSLSLSTPQARGARRELLLQILERLGLGQPAEVRELADLTEGPLSRAD